MEAVQIATGKRYAVKILSKAQLIKQKKVKYATVEKDALAKLSGLHPGSIKMHAAFQDETSLCECTVYVFRGAVCISGVSTWYPKL